MSRCCQKLASLSKLKTRKLTATAFLHLWSTGARFLKVPRTFRARKAIRKTTTRLFCKAGLFICCKGNKNKSNCKVSCLETPSFLRYKENYVTRNTPEKFRDFRETGPRSWRDNLLRLLTDVGVTSLTSTLTSLVSPLPSKLFL